MNALQIQQELLSKLESNKFNINDEVYIKYTGLPCTGKVVALMPSFIYCGLIQTTTGFKIWSKIDKDWYNKYVYYVKYDKPAKNISYKEFEEQNPDIKEDALRKAYDEIPLLAGVICIEKDLGLVADMDKYS